MWKIEILDCRLYTTKEGLSLKEEDKQKFLEDFKKAEITKKLDMWYFALEQVTIWDELIAEMSMIALLYRNSHLSVRFGSDNAEISLI